MVKIKKLDLFNPLVYRLIFICVIIFVGVFLANYLLIYSKDIKNEYYQKGYIQGKVDLCNEFEPIFSITAEIRMAGKLVDTSTTCVIPVGNETISNKPKPKFLKIYED